MPYTSRLVQIRNGEYLADCESDYEDADQSSKTGRASKPSSSTISVPVFDPEGNDVSSPSQFEMSAFRLPTFTFLRNELSIPERYQRLSIDGDSGLKSLAGPRNARTSEGPPIRRPTLVKRSSIFNKSLPPLPSRRSSMRSSTHMPRRSRRLVYSKISAPNHIANVPRMSEGDEYPPDGGTMAWLHVLAGHLVIFNAQGLNQSYGVFQAYYETIRFPHEAPSTIAWIGSLQVFFLFAMSIVTSPLMDKGYFRFCFNGGSILLFVSVLVTSYCTKWWHMLLVQGLLTGIGMGLIFGSGVVVLMSYFSKHVGLATGIASCGGAVGGMVIPAVAERLVFRIGYSWTVRAIALIVFCTLLPANLITRQRPTWKRKGPLQMDKTLLNDAPFLLMTAGLFFAFWGIYIGFYYIVIYAQTNLHTSSTTSISLLIMLNAANLPGRLLPPLLSDSCLGPLNTLIPCTLLTAFFLYVWIGSSSLTALTMVICAYGFVAGGVQSVYNAAVWEMSMRKRKSKSTSMATLRGKKGGGGGGGEEGEGEEEEEGGDMEMEKEKEMGVDEGALKVRLAVVLSVIGIATLTGAPLGGALISRMGGEYLGAQLFAGSSVLLGGVLLGAARWKRDGWRAARV